MAGERDGAGATRGRRRTDRSLGPDARPRLPRRARPRAPAGDPLERPAHGRGVRRDRGACRARAADRADREPRPHRLHCAQAPLAAPTRARDVRTHPPHPASEGLRAAPAHGRARDRRGGRVGDAPLRRRPPPLERGGAGRARAACGVAAPGARVDGDRRSRRPAGGGARRGRHRAGHALGRARYVRGRARDAARLRRRPTGARARLLPRRARTLGGDGRDALCGGVAPVVPPRARAWRDLRRAHRGGGALVARRGGPHVPPVPPGRTHAPRGP